MEMRNQSDNGAVADSGATQVPQRFMNVQEAAALLRLAPRTLDKKRIIGDGPRFYKFGTRVVYAREDLLAWAEARARSATGESSTGDTRKAR